MVDSILDQIPGLAKQAWSFLAKSLGLRSLRRNMIMVAPLLCYLTPLGAVEFMTRLLR